MADEIAVDSFLNLLGQSDLLPDDQLLALMTEFRGEGKGQESAQKLADELVERGILTAWQAEMLLQRKHRGFRLGPYRILKPLGQGGMSKVFLAEHEMMRRRCAIKVLPSKYQEDADLLSRFHLEARAVAALDHPNIVRAYDFNKDVRSGKEIHYLVMEYVEGPDLRRMVEEQGPLDYRKAADFISQAAEGLAHAHNAGFVHRDIKPANLLVDPHGVLKVLDLGLAMFTFESEQAWNPAEGEQSAVGTADYVAPEQVMDSRNVDGRVDIYSLGLTFYFLLTGRRPFSKPTIAELLMAHQTEKPEPIGAFRPDVPLELDAIIDKMTAKKPFQRYQTAKEVAERLRTWMKESGSARAYSRISALMAEAMRSKHSSSEETTSGESHEADLQLASLDEESPAARGAAEAKSTEATSADAAAKDRQPGAADRAKPGSDKHPTGQAPGRSARSGTVSHESLLADENDETTLAAGRGALVPGLAVDDLLSALPPTETLPPVVTGSGPHPLPGRSPRKKESHLSEILHSPWLWVGVVGVVILVLVTVLIVFFLPSSKKPNSQQARNASKSSPSIRKEALPTPSLKQGESSKTTSPKATKTAATPPAAESTAKKSEVKQPEPAKPPVPEPIEVKPAEPATPSTPAPVEPKSPESPAPSPPKAATPDELLAGLTKISFDVQINSALSDPNGRLSMTVMQKATSAAKALGHIVVVAEDSPAVMKIELKPVDSTESFGVVMSAELTCTAPDGTTATAWKKSQPIVALPKGGKARLDQVLQPSVIRPKVGKFLEQFQDAVKQAREKATAKE